MQLIDHLLTGLGYAICLFLAAMLLFGLLAAKHIDPSKVISESEYRANGPYPDIPEELLTPRGKRLAFYRNLCAAVGFGALIIYGSAMALLDR